MTTKAIDEGQRPRWPWMRTGLSVVSVFLSMVVVGMWLPDRVVFPGAPLVDPVLLVSSTRVEVPVDGALLVGRHWQDADRDPDAPLVLVFGGNGMNAEDFGGVIASILVGQEVMAVNYRGYGSSSGRAGLVTFESDALAVYDAVPPGRRVVVVGASIGSAAGAHLLVERPVEGAVLITPFDDLRAVVREHAGWAAFLVRNPLEPADDLAKASRPVALISAPLDTLFGPDRLEGVRKAARSVVSDVSLEGAGHNSVYSHPDFAKALQSAVDAVAPGS